MHITQSLAAVSSKDLFEPDGAILLMFAGIFIILLGILAIIGACIAPAANTKGNFSVNRAAAKALALVAGIAMISSGVAICNNYGKAVTESRIAFFAERGVSIDETALKAMNLTKRAPDRDTKFSIAQAVMDGKIVSVRAEWVGGEMKVYSTEGQELQPVNPKK